MAYNRNMRFTRIILMVAAVFFVAACTAATEKVVDETAMPAIPPTSTSSPVTWTSTVLPDAPDSLQVESPTPTVSPTSEAVFQICSPLAEHEIRALPEIVSDPYAPPPVGKDDRHQGVDFAYFHQEERQSIEGEGVQAILAGRVAASIEVRLPYGNMVILETPRTALSVEIIRDLGIDPGESLYHLYAHMNRAPRVSLGEWVDCGQLLGMVGKTGYNIVNPHLHLETRIGPANTEFPGMVFYDTQATAEEMGNYRLWRMSGVFRHFDPMILFVEYWLGSGNK